MKFRTGFVSNSSTASFIVKTRPTDWDKSMKDIGMEDVYSFTLPKEKVELLKKYGFVPTKSENPFQKELNTYLDDPPMTADTDNDALLGFWITCNHDYVLQFLVANDIPFKASVHYGHELYSYDVEDGYIYILRNFGLEFLSRPKKLEEILNDPEEKKWVNPVPMKKISKKDFLSDYDEETSIAIMKGGY